MDISLESYAINEMISTFVNISVATNEPAIAILGAYYDNTESNPWHGCLQIFDVYASLLLKY